MSINRLARSFIRNTFPPVAQEWIRRIQRVFAVPSVGHVDFRTLRRVTPLSRAFGYDRGLPVDRYYVEQFLKSQAASIQGHVLEIGDNTYTHQFGSQNVTQSDVLFPVLGNPHATIVADLTKADHVPSNSFDCIICTQTLPFIYETRSALQTLHRLLKPSGVLLLTATGISHVSRNDMEAWGDYWRFTTLSLSLLLKECFPAENVQVQSYGNVLSACAFLYGLATADLTPEELAYHDDDYQLVTGARAVKATNRIIAKTD